MSREDLMTVMNTKAGPEDSSPLNFYRWQATLQRSPEEIEEQKATHCALLLAGMKRPPARTGRRTWSVNGVKVPYRPHRPSKEATKARRNDEAKHRMRALRALRKAQKTTIVSSL